WRSGEFAVEGLRIIGFALAVRLLLLAATDDEPRPRTMRTRTIALFLALPAALCGCSKPAPPAAPPPTVEVGTPLLQRISGWDDYSGRFEPVDSVDVRPRVSGTIESVNFEDGQVVKKGD